MSLSTSAYRTKTIIEPRNNKSLPGYWPIGIDVGYSSVKCFSPNIAAQFPFCALPHRPVSFRYSLRRLGRMPRILFLRNAAMVS